MNYVETAEGRLGYGLPLGYNPSAAYALRDVVHFGGSSYVVLQDGVSGMEPMDDGVHYSLLVRSGADGSGNAVWHAGTAVTGTGSGVVAGVPGSRAGDMYVNEDSGNLYIATAADTWRYLRNINGLSTNVNGVEQVGGRIDINSADIPIAGSPNASVQDALNNRMIPPLVAAAGSVAVFDAARNVVAGSGARKIVAVWTGALAPTETAPASPAPVVWFNAEYKDTDREFICVWDGTYLYGVRIAGTGTIVFHGLYAHSGGTIGVRTLLIAWDQEYYRLRQGIVRHLTANGVAAGSAGSVTAIYALRV